MEYSRSRKYESLMASSPHNRDSREISIIKNRTPRMLNDFKRSFLSINSTPRRNYKSINSSVLEPDHNTVNLLVDNLRSIRHESVKRTNIALQARLELAKHRNQNLKTI